MPLSGEAERDLERDLDLEEPETSEKERDLLSRDPRDLLSEREPEERLSSLEWRDLSLDPERSLPRGDLDLELE